VSAGAEELRALETLGRLTRGALHELANPLLALLGSAELALADAEPGTALHQRIGVIKQTGGELGTIVRALQAFVRSQYEPPRRISLEESARSAAELVTLVTPLKSVAVVGDTDVHVTAAPGAIACELVELLVAALEDADRGTSIELVVGVDGGDAVASVVGAGEVRFPAA